jgi:hypothetical protein
MKILKCTRRQYRFELEQYFSGEEEYDLVGNVAGDTFQGLGGNMFRF